MKSLRHSPKFKIGTIVLYKGYRQLRIIEDCHYGDGTWWYELQGDIGVAYAEEEFSEVNLGRR